MRKYSRRDILTSLAALGGLGMVPTAFGQAQKRTSPSAASQRITRFEVIPVRVPMHERVRDVFAKVYRKQGINRDYYDSSLIEVFV